MTNRAAVVAAYAAARLRRLPDRAAVEAWQGRRLRRVLTAARERYPFYRDVPWADSPAAQLAAFPVLEKADAVAHFADLNDRGLTLAACLTAARAAEARRDFTASLAGVSIGLSSGTSGRQTVFLTSPAERARWAGEALARLLPGGMERGGLVRGGRVALVLRAGGPLYESVGSGRVAFRFFDLAVPAEEHVAALASFRPTVLAAPPHVLRVVAGAVGRGAPIAPERVLSVAEVLDPHDRRAIEAGLGVRVDQVYQATEGFLGASCGEGRLHLNEDLVLVEREWHDDGRRFTPVVTDLFRTTQAVIRRRLDDVLVAGDGACPCGSPFAVLDAVEGRADDVLLFRRAVAGGEAGAGAGSSGATGAPGDLRPFYADFVRGAVLGVDGVADFRVTQHAPGSVALAVDPAHAFPAAAAALRAAVVGAGLMPPEVEPAAITPRAPLEKVRRVRRTFPIEREGSRP